MLYLSETQKIQKVGLSILKDVDEFCRKHGLRYYIYCGTLLGCIRHNGFIPWDDDVDIAMPLKDYIVFRKTAREELEERYIVSDIHSDCLAANNWIKVYRRGTAYYEIKTEDGEYHKEIGIDVYPLIGAYEGMLGNIQAKAIVFQKTFTGRNYRIAKKYSYVNHQINLWRSIDRLPRFLVYVMNDIIEFLFWKDPEGFKHCGTIDAARFMGKFETKDWEESIDGNFEGHLFLMPGKYDKILKIIYGDYMKLPPVEKRVTTHFVGETAITISEEIAEEIGIKQ